MREKPVILAVDDEDRNLRLLEAMLGPLGYEIFFARDGEEALQRVAEVSPDLILLDIMMPKMDGFEVTKRLKDNEETKAIPIVVVTALNELEHRVQAIENGADDILNKPVEKIELRARVNSLLKVKAYHDYTRNYQRHLEDSVAEKTRLLSEAFEKAKRASLETIIRLSRAAEYKDEETASHIRRVSHYAAALAEKIGLKSGEIERILYASPMHDIGKIGIPEKILLKKGKLTPSEWEIMKKHTTIGAEILKGSDGGFIREAEIIALTHHERWNGTGYPRGLRGEEIPVSGRITAIVDVFDALTVERPYRAPISEEKAFEYIQTNTGILFDRGMANAFLTLRDQISALRETYKPGDDSLLVQFARSWESLET